MKSRSEVEEEHEITQIRPGFVLSRGSMLGVRMEAGTLQATCKLSRNARKNGFKRVLGRGRGGWRCLKEGHEEHHGLSQASHGMFATESANGWAPSCVDTIVIRR